MLLNIAILEDDPKQSNELYKLLTTWAACHGHVFHIYQYTNGRLIKPWVKGYPINNPEDVAYSRTRRG